ncbi:MAG: hypothetical protein JW384_04181 [Nitrosomonadaceae bacterium]|nr:hypothetical protein [Nitrosomonadaceae bacterium]
MNLDGLNEEEREEVIDLYNDEQDRRAEEYVLMQDFAKNN